MPTCGTNTHFINNVFHVVYLHTMCTAGIPVRFLDLPRICIKNRHLKARTSVFLHFLPCACVLVNRNFSEHLGRSIFTVKPVANLLPDNNFFLSKRNPVPDPGHLFEGFEHLPYCGTRKQNLAIFLQITPRNGEKNWSLRG